MSTNEPTITIYEIDRALTKCEDIVILQRDRVDAHDRELATLHERCAKLEEIVFVLRATVRSIDESLPQLTRSHAPAPVFEPEGDDVVEPEGDGVIEPERTRIIAAPRAPRAPKASGGKITDVLGVRIMDAVRDSQLGTVFTRSKVIDLFACPPPHATRALGDLVEAGKLRLEGVKGGAKYIVVAA